MVAKSAVSVRLVPVIKTIAQHTKTGKSLRWERNYDKGRRQNATGRVADGARSAESDVLHRSQDGGRGNAVAQRVHV